MPYTDHHYVTETKNAQDSASKWDLICSQQKVQLLEMVYEHATCMAATL
jgi:hypothetical protein